MLVRSLGREDPLRKEMATHSSVLAWEIPWTEEPGSSWGHKRIRHNLVTKQEQISQVAVVLKKKRKKERNKIRFTYVSVTMLGLCCCMHGFSSCIEQGLLCSCGAQALIAVASLVEHRFQPHELQ